ncbi:MAG TPA: polysaccharide deacetylase family protein [Tepidisphaeraceae bacterium]|nr:polysaccharide deacetylase family protein [Tepidisphaeraceae bacterium]
MTDVLTTATDGAAVQAGRASPPAAQGRFRSLLATAGRLVKNTALLVYLYGGYVPLRDWTRGLLGRPRLVVLTYHRVGSRDVLSKPTEEFRRDLQYLKRHYECIRLVDLHDRLCSGAPIKRPIAVVTFDDGYRDNFTEAVPVLLEEKVPATFFVATGFVETERDFPHDLRADRSRGDGAPARRFPKLTWNDLLQMEAAGFEIGSHTVNHTDLGGASQATVSRELVHSLLTLNTMLGPRRRAFSFPWGKPENMSECAFTIARQLGYYAVASACGGANRRRGTLFHIRRVDAGNGHLSPLAFCARVAGLDPEYWRIWLRQLPLPGWIGHQSQRGRDPHA